MKVRALKKYRSEIPDHLGSLIQEDGAFITIGQEYEVHGIVYYNRVRYLKPQQATPMPGVADIQIVDDFGFPAWYPCALFDLVDGHFSDDWQVNLFAHNDMHGPLVVIGPEFIARDEESYSAMVELQADQVDRFWKRIDALEKASNGGDEDWGE